MTSHVRSLQPPPLLTADLSGIGGRIKTVSEDFEVEEIPACKNRVLPGLPVSKLTSVAATAWKCGFLQKGGPALVTRPAPRPTAMLPQ